MQTVSFDAWANLVVSGKETGERKPCRVTLAAQSGELLMALDKELRFTASRPGMAAIVFFKQPQGDDLILKWPFDGGVDTGYTLALTPTDPASPQEG